MNQSVFKVQDIFEKFCSSYPQEVALAKKLDGKWTTYSTKEFEQNVKSLSKGLLQLGISSQDKVAIISFNRPEWLFVDVAIQLVGAVSVPMYPTITVDDYAYIFSDADVKVVL